MNNMMNDLAKLILRLMFGGLMLFHGIGKVTHGVDQISQMLEKMGLPGFIAYGVIVGEVVAPILMIVGFLTRPAALIFAFNMVVAVAMAHRADIFSLTEHGTYALELNAMYFLGGICIFLLGPGVYSASRGRGPLD